MKNLLGLALVATMAALALPAVAQNSGEATYKAKCQMCHGADGSGNTPAGKAMKAMPLTSPAIAKESNQDLIDVTKKGKGKMPAYAGKLSDGQIKEVVAYVGTLEKK